MRDLSMQKYLARQHKGMVKLRRLLITRFNEQQKRVKDYLTGAGYPPLIEKGTGVDWTINDAKLQELLSLGSGDFLKAVQSGELDIFEAGAAAGTEYVNLIGEVASPIRFDREDPLVVNAACGDLATRMAGLDATSQAALSGLVKEGMAQGWSLGNLTKQIDSTFRSWRSGDPGKQSRAEMVARTESAMAYNRGSLNVWNKYGYDNVEVYDGGQANSCEECDRVSGEIWTNMDALGNPVEHPNCTRSFAPTNEPATAGAEGSSEPSTSEPGAE